MDIHIDKKIAGLMLVSLVVGGLIGGSIGFMVREEGHRGERDRYEMMQGRFDSRADGDTNYDQGDLINQYQQKTTPPVTTPPIPTPAQ